MIILLSPAKSLEFEHKVLDNHTLPVFENEAFALAAVLKKKSKTNLKELMSISDKLAETNYNRYQSFENTFTEQNSNSAIYAFRGDVYQGIEIDDFKKTEIKRAQKQIRILSGLYGYLRPLDLIQPYRLEMGTKLKVKKDKNLYEFWGEKITDALNEELRLSKNKVVINLASNEYYKSIKKEKVEGDVYYIHFKEMKNGILKFISFNAKKARGYMTRYIIKENIKTPEQLLNFDTEGYKFEPSLSSEKEFTFIR